MGSGIAKNFKELYPECYEADCKTKKGDLTKLGTYSFAKGKDGKYIINMYNQGTYGNTGRFTSYDAVISNLEKLKEKLESFDEKIQKTLIVGFPKGMGSVRGGANWKIVELMIKETFDNTPFDVRIYDYDQG